DLHIGIYELTRDIREASVETVDRMAAMLPDLNSDTKVLDIGAGYGGSMRRIVRQSGCEAVCLNLSETQNDTNRYKTRRAGLSDRLRVAHGVFEEIPDENDAYDVVWSQDAILHSDQRER